MMHLFSLRFNDYFIYKGRSMSIISGRKNVKVGPRFEHKTAVFQSQCSQAQKFYMFKFSLTIACQK